MQPVARSGHARVRAALCLSLFALNGAADAALARPIRVLAFNVPVNTAYDARLNGTTLRTIASSQAGSLDFTFDAGNGATLAFVTADLAPPPAPLLSSVIPDGAGCALADWVPSGDPTVVGYVVYAGTRSVASGAASDYDVAIDAGSASAASVCSLPPGVNYVAVRARNFAGVLSAYSVELPVTITTVAVLISSFDANLREDGVRLSWHIEADEVVQGYRIYRSEDGGPQAAVVDALLPADTREYLDGDTRSATRYEYVLGATREDGSEIRSAPVAVATPALALSLGQNAPNPFNPSTRIPFTLDRAMRAVVRVYDVRGALVATVFDGELGEGRHTVPWNGLNDAGEPVSSGIYVYALTTDRRTISKKMALLK